jgi:outer membrane receptor protein involved in Fe transport
MSRMTVQPNRREWRGREPRSVLLVAWLGLVLVAGAAQADALPAGGGKGRLRGRLLASDTSEPISFADVLLLPADSTMRKAGCMTNTDGSFLLDAAPGTYTLQVRALSYATKRITNVVVQTGGLQDFIVSLEPEALVQEVVEVEAEARRNNETALLNERKRAATVGDAVSAEVVRRTPDSDASEVLRRVTGLSVFQGKYVFVRGMGERYSSTEVDGVRLASPEQNKRVVPLDLVPASLLENVVVQKTYSADRPGEFGGGDVQVRTRDFPGQRTFLLAVGQGVDEGTTFGSFRTYPGGKHDAWGFGAGARELPSFVQQVAGRRPIYPRGVFDPPGKNFSADTLALMGQSFRDVWTPTRREAVPAGSLSESYGDQFKLFGRELGVVQAGIYSRAFKTTHEAERLYGGSRGPDAMVYDYHLSTSTENVQLGGLLGLSYRLAPNHSIHVRGLYAHDAENQTRYYEGYNFSQSRNMRSNRLLYVERSVLSGNLEGRHELRGWARPRFDWSASLSEATRLEPDRRETIYQENVNADDPENVVRSWTLYGGGLGATRYFGDLKDRGRGLEGKGTIPFKGGWLGGGKLELGGSYQTKDRDAYYRRFLFKPAPGADVSQPPEVLFGPDAWKPGYGGAELVDATQPEDNYFATQKLRAFYVNLDVPWGPLRGLLGARVERGEQDVSTYNFRNFPANLVAYAKLADTDLLPAANVTLALAENTNLRFAASRTLSRPDLRELTPGTTLEVLNGLRTSGNPDLKRARIDNYDLRFERFPGLGEVVAMGTFYKRLLDPIEQVITPGDAPVLRPENSRSGWVYGVETEARLGLGRFAAPLRRLSLNANFTVIQSRVELNARTTQLGSSAHPLQGQSNVLMNNALAYASDGGRFDATVLVNIVGRRLQALGLRPRPDRYEAPRATLDAALNWSLRSSLRVKLAAKNLTDAREEVLDLDRVTYAYDPGRSVALSVNWSL